MTQPARLSTWQARVLAQEIAESVKRDDLTGEKILRLCSETRSSAQRSLLAEIIKRMDGEEAVLAGLNLINDAAVPAVPRGVWERLEEVFVEHHPYQGSQHTFTLVPIASNSQVWRLKCS